MKRLVGPQAEEAAAGCVLLTPPAAQACNEADPPDLSTLGCIHSVETCGAVDGPGLRYVLFLGGCPLRCQYCHNPDAQGRPKGTWKTAGEVLKDVLRYRKFLKHGGGLTISGGEPLMQARFVQALLAGAKGEGIHTALDTSGYLEKNTSDDLLRHVDLVLLDIKSWDPATYREVTGVDIQPTLRLARRLDDLKIPVWIRFVLVPGLTDAEENVNGLAGFVSTLKNVDRVEILPFHKMAEYKYKELGLPYNLTSTPSPTTKQVSFAREVFARHGVEAI